MPRLPGPEALGGLPSMNSGARVPQVSGRNPVAEAAGNLGQGLVALSAEHRDREDALQAAEADARLTTGLTGLRRQFDTDPDWQTYQPRFSDEANRIREEAAGMITNQRVRDRWLPRANVAVSNAFDHIVGRQDRLRGEHEYDRIDSTLGQLGSSYVTAPDDTSRDAIMRNMEDTIELGRRSGVVPADRIRDLTRRHLHGSIEADVLARPDSYAALLELREGDQRVSAPSTGEISELGLSRLQSTARRPGMTPAQVRKAEGDLRSETAAISKMLGDELKDVDLTQAQHDALVSFGVARGRDALRELVPLVRSEGPGRLDSLSAAMRTRGGLTTQEQPSLADEARMPGPIGPVEVRPVPGERTPAGARPRQGNVEGIVLHHTSGTTLDSALSQNRIARTGYNYYIDRDGTAYVLAADGQVMNHVMPPGNSARIPGAWPRLSSDNTIGIGVVAQNDADITDAQRNTLRGLTTQIATQHGVDPQNIIGHGDIQDTRERSEGSTSREFREGRTRTAQRSGTMTDASPPGNDPRIDEYADLVAGRAPSSRYSGMPVDRRRVLVGKLEQALRPSLMADMDDDLEMIRQTGQPRRLPDGTTSFSRSARVLTRNQFERYQIRLEEAQAQYRALNGLQDMTPEQVEQRREILSPSRNQGSRFNVINRTRTMFDTAIERMREEGEKDPAQSVEGGIPLRRIGTQRRETMGPDGQPVLSSETDVDHRLAPAREVAEAHALVRRRHDGRLLNIGTNENGALVIQPIDNGAEGARAQQDAWRIIIDARLDAQARRGIADRFRAPITKAEGDELLNMPRRVADQTEFRNLMAAAVDRAYERYGPYARQALDAAIRFRSNLNNDQSELAGSMVRSMVQGTGVRTEEINRLTRSLQLSREQRAWLGGGDFQMEGVGSFRVPGGPQPRAPEPRRGWLGGTQPAGTPGWPGAPAEVENRQIRSAGERSLGVSRQRPTPEDISDLMRFPDLQREFDMRFGPGSAAGFLQGQPPRRR